MARYESLTKEMTMRDLIKLVTGEDCTENLENYEEYCDVLTGMVFTMFPAWWQRVVREEQNELKKLLNKKTTGRCERCNRESDRLELHHIRPVREFGGNEVDNLVLLCPECHKRIKDHF